MTFLVNFLNPKQKKPIVKLCQKRRLIFTIHWCSFSPTFMCIHLAVDRPDSISNTEVSHVNLKDSIILHIWRWFTMPYNICHILMTEYVGPPVNLCFLPTGTQIRWGGCNNGSSGHMNQQSQQQKRYHSPQSMGRSTLWNWNLGESLIGLKQPTGASRRGFKASTAYSLGDRS